MTRTRYAAAAAALMVAAGAVAMLVALVALPGPWWQGYVSEAGTSGQAHPGTYRWGLLVLAGGVGVLGGALRRGAAAVFLLVAAVMAGTSGVVQCSPGCPLPPYETTTTVSVVHTAATIVGLVALAAAMAATALTASRAVTRRLAAGAVALILPLGVALGLFMLLTGRGTPAAVLERLVLVVAVSWLAGTATLIDRPVPPRSGPQRHHSSSGETGTAR